MKKVAVFGEFNKYTDGYCYSVGTRCDINIFFVIFAAEC